MINYLQLKDFGPHKDFNLVLNGKSLFIIGENGSGKSCLLEAISLAFTGKFAKSEYVIADFINDQSNAKDFLIKIGFSIGKENYEIERTSTKTKLKLPDGNVLSKQAEIQSMFPFDPELFYNLAYVKQFQIANFLTGDKSLGDKLSNLLFDTKRLSSAYNIVMKKGNDYVKKLEMLEHSLIKENETLLKFPDIIELEKEILELEESITNINTIDLNDLFLEQSVRKTIEKETMNINMLTEKLNSEYMVEDTKLPEFITSQKDIDSFREENRVNEASLREEEKLIKEKEDLLLFKSEALNELKIFLNLNIDLIKNEYTEDELETIYKLKNNIHSYLTTENHTMDSDVPEILEFIKTKYDIDAETIQHHKKLFVSIKDKFSKFREHFKKYKINDSINVDNIESVIDEEVKKIDKALKTLPMSDIPYDWEALEKIQLDFIKHGNFINEKNTLMLKINTSKSMIEGNKSKLNYPDLTDDAIEKMFRVIEHKQMLINNLNTKKQNLEFIMSNKNKIEDLKFEINNIKYILNENILPTKEALKQAPSYIRKTIFGSIENIANNDFKKLFSFMNLGDVEIDWDKMSIKVGNRKFGGISGAQECTLALVLRQAILKKMGSSVPLMLIDEPTISLDEQRKIDLKSFISNIINGTNIQLIVSTHDVDIIDTGIHSITVSL